MSIRDEELIAAFYDGTEDAFETLFLRHKRPIFNFALRMLANRADAEDVTAEVFMTLYTKKFAFKPTAKFTTWLFTVARNSCISHIRKRKKTLSLWVQKKDSQNYDAWDIPDPQNISREELIEKERAGHVRQALQQLPVAQKEALILREYHQMNYADIADVLQCSLENVKVLIHRARGRLAQILPPSIMEGHDG